MKIKGNFRLAAIALAVFSVAGAANAYPLYQRGQNYQPYEVVELEGHVFQNCASCYSRGDIPVVGQRWSWGNSWNDLGLVGRNSAPVSKPASSAPASAWQSGKTYRAGDIVSYNGLKYKALMNIDAGFYANMPPRQGTRWQQL